MFRRHWSGLPADPVFPSDLGELGYFVNRADEIRSIADPNKYFKFFLSKNERWNYRQRFAMNDAIQKIVHDRLEAMGMSKLRLPLGAGPDDPHVPIFATSDVAENPRVLVIFGEPTQDLGILAYRVASGRGGLDRGSMVSLVRAIRSPSTEASDGETQSRTTQIPAVVLANPGQLWWWPEGKRSLTHAGRQAVPMASAVHWGRFHDPAKNEVPENETPARHVRCVFDAVRSMVPPTTKVDVLAVGDSAEEVEGFLNNDDVWSVWGSRMNSLAILGGFYKSADIQCEGFKTFMKERARAYIIHDDPLGYPVAGPEGNPKAIDFTSFGCPVFSAGEANIAEMMLITAHPLVLEWMHEVAATPDYKNPFIEAASYRDGEAEVENDDVYPGLGDVSYGAEQDSWGDAPESESASGDQAKAISDVQSGASGLDTRLGREVEQANGREDKEGNADGQQCAKEGIPAMGDDMAAEEEARMRAEVLGALGSIEEFVTARLEDGEE